MNALDLTVVILTKDEEHDLPRCLAALQGWAPVVVVDSGSRDRTLEIATASEAVVLTHPFSTFGQQRNWALDQGPQDREWILFLDADEVATPEFRQEVERAIANASAETAGFYCCWKLMLGERWLRRSDAFPKWQFRLVRSGRARFTDFGHGQKEGEVDGRIDFIREPYLHYAFSKGWSIWLDRHNRYSTQEAKTRLAAPVDWRLILKARGSQRNKLLKPLVSRIPLWPAIRFGIDYVGRLGFLEGREGLIYSVNLAYYEFLIVLKMDELRSGLAGSDGLADPSAIRRAAFRSKVGSALRWLSVLLCLALVLYFGLVPTPPRGRLFELPSPARRWLNAHDDLANFAVFAIFGSLVFALPRTNAAATRGSRLANLLHAPKVRLFLLLALVAGLELLQLAIPGRISDWRDVATGGAGVIAAWLIQRSRQTPR